VPVKVTIEIWLLWTFWRKSVKVISSVLRWKFVEKFQIKAAMTTRTIQNKRLFKVEFMLLVIGVSVPRLPRLPRAP